MTIMTRPLTTENRMLRATGGEQITLPSRLAIGATYDTPTTGELVLSEAAHTSAGRTEDIHQSMLDAESDVAARMEAAQLSRELEFAQDADRADILNKIDGLMTQRSVRINSRAREAVAAGRMQQPTVLAEKYADIGLKFDRPMTLDEAKLLADGKRAEIIRNAIISRTPGGVTQTIGMFGAGLAAMATDPLEVASMFIPVVGAGGKVAAVARFGRVGGRVAIGVAEGAVGSALTEPVYGVLSRAQQLDYTMSDALLNIGLGAVLGGGIGGVAGVLSPRAHPTRTAGNAVPAEPRAADIPRPVTPDGSATPDVVNRPAVPEAVMQGDAVDIAPAAARAKEAADVRALAAEQRPAAVTALRQFVTDQSVNVAPVMPQIAPSASWIIRDRASGNPVMEVFNRNVADAVNLEKYEVVPILDYLVSINGRQEASVADAPALASGVSVPQQAVADIPARQPVITAQSKAGVPMVAGSTLVARNIRSKAEANALATEVGGRVVRNLGRQWSVVTDSIPGIYAPQHPNQPRPADQAAALARHAARPDPLADEAASTQLDQIAKDFMEADVADMEAMVAQMELGADGLADMAAVRAAESRAATYAKAVQAAAVCIARSP